MIAQGTQDTFPDGLSSQCSWGRFLWGLPSHEVSLAGAIGRPRLSVASLNRPQCSSPLMSALKRITDSSRTSRQVRFAPMIGIGGSLAAPPLPHHRTYGSVYGGSSRCANTLDACRLGVPAHSSPRAVRWLPLPPAGLPPSAP